MARQLIDGCCSEDGKVVFSHQRQQYGVRLKMMLKVSSSPYPFLNRQGVFDGSQHLSLGEQKAGQTRDSFLLIFSFQVMGTMSCT